MNGHGMSLKKEIKINMAKIAVICYNTEEFKTWKNKTFPRRVIIPSDTRSSFQIDNDEYFRVTTIDNTRGRSFDHIITLDGSVYNRNIDAINECISQSLIRHQEPLFLKEVME